MSKTTLIDVKYFFYSIKFKPYANLRDKYDSHQIMKDVASHLANIKRQGKAVLVDRNEHKETSDQREMFLSSATMIPKDRRVRCTMALIRTGRKPKLMEKGTFNLKDIKKLGEIVEVTNFFIDYSTNENVICVEQNHHGANITDIEYYFKKIARDDLQLARGLDLKVYMTDTIDKTIASLKNVLSFKIKIRPVNFALIDKELSNHYFKSFDTVSKIYKPEFLKIEAFFKKNGRKMALKKENKIATSMFAKALEIFKSSPEETEYYDNFVVEYENSKGVEDSFNLLKNKKVIIIKIEEGEELTLKKSYNFISSSITDFVKTL